MLHLATQSGEEKYGGLHQLPLQTLSRGRQRTEHHSDGFLEGVTFKSCLLMLLNVGVVAVHITFIFFFIGRLSFKRRQEKEARTSFEGINWRLKEIQICSPGTRRGHSCQSCTWQRAPASLSGGVPTGPGCLSCQHWIISQPFHSGKHFHI